MWAGSKDRDYPKIKPYIPDIFQTYYEPFLGGGAVYFRLLADRGEFPAVCADVNVDLLNTYEVIRDDPEGLISLLPPTKDKAIFREWMSSIFGDRVERAAQFLYLNRNRFFGMGGWMNADRYARGAVIDRIRLFSPLMQQTSFVSSCWECQFQAQDFVFCDPPYPETNNRACYRIEDDDVLRLNLDFLHRVADSQASFFWVTKHLDVIEERAEAISGVRVEKKVWTFRQPKKGVQTSHEIYVSRAGSLSGPGET